MQASDFVHLHNHSTYSLLEGLPSPEEIVTRAKELKQNTVALSDRGFTYGLIEFYQVAQKHGIKPILGMEVFVAARTRLDKESGVDTKSAPLVLLAENQEGYENLLRMATAAALEGMYYKPRVDAELLQKFGKGLIALTGPISGQIPQAILAEDDARVQELTEQLQSFFGKENVFYELLDLPNVTGQAEVNQQLIAWSKKLNVPLVVTSNSYYTRREDAEAHDILLCIQKNANVADPGRFSMRDTDYSMRTFEELEKAFSHIPEALENTRTIADRTALSFQFGNNQIPRFPVPNNASEEDELTRLAQEGLHRRYETVTPAVQERLNYELSVIKQVKFSGYFLIVADFVNEAKRRGITVGPGRGSAAGSMVSYALGITGIDPMQHGLLFERFLNPERISMPDIDLDFADDRRDEVLEYVREKYGTDRVVQICTFGTLAARAAVKDVGRAYGIPFLEMNTLAKLISDRPGTKLKDALETVELKSVYNSNEIYRKIIDAALKLEGKARHISVHACGVIISPEPAIHYTAVQRAPKDENTIITQYSAKPLESLGLLKMDFLGLTNLTVIQTALAIIKRTREEEINIEQIPLSDRAAFHLLQLGDTTGVFQLESGGMRRYLKQLKPTRFEDIVAMCALYRPGPMDSIPEYIKRKNNPKLVRYEVPELEPFLKETHGIIVYQEQVQRVVQEFAGFSLGAGYLLIKAVAKKIPSLLKEQREKFLKGALEKGHKLETAEKIFALIEPFAGYGFNKSHSVGYGLIAYQTAYLKANYPAEFMAALLSSDAQNTDRVMIEIEECRAMGIDVLPPDVNESLSQFTVIAPKETKNEKPETKNSQWSIRFGLAAVKGVGESSVQQIIEERERNGRFTSLEDFARRLPVKILNKKLLESLAKAGALDSFGERRAILEHYDTIVDYRKAYGEGGGGQTDLFASTGMSQELPPIDLPVTPPATAQQKLQWEKETLGLYVSSHPLAGLRKYIGKKAHLIGELTTKEVSKKVTLAGIQEGIKKIRTKKGDTMAIVMLEDPTGKMEITLFPKMYAEAAPLLEQPDTVLVVGGTLDYRAGQLQLRADAIKRSSLSTMINRSKEEGTYDAEEAKRGLTLTRRTLEEDEESVEAIDEEGNVIAGETVKLQEKIDDDFLGPLGKWVTSGMPINEIAVAIGFPDLANAGESSTSQVSKLQDKNGQTKNEQRANELTSNDSPTRISIHTIDLPPRAPKQLLLDLKRVFETFPGRERVQLRIGEQLIPLPLTITMSTILRMKIDETIEKYAVSPA